MAEIKQFDEGDSVHLTAVEAVPDEDDDSSEIYRRGSETLLDDSGTVVDVRGDEESIIELDKQRLTYPDDDDYVSPSVRLSAGTVYPEWELTDDAPKGKWKPIPAPAAFVEELERVEE